MDQKAGQKPKQVEVDGDSLNHNLQELDRHVKKFKDMYHSLPEHCRSSNCSKICSTHDLVLNFFGRHPTLDRRPSCPRAEGFEQLLKVQNARKISEIVQLMGKMVEDQQELGEELKITKEKLHGAEREIGAQKDFATWKAKVIEDHEAVLLERDREINRLRESMSEQNVQRQAEITKLSKEKEVNVKEWELCCQTLEEEAKQVKVEKEEMECQFQAEITKLSKEITKLSKEMASLGDKVKERKLRCQNLEEEAKRVKAGKEEMECPLQAEITKWSKEKASLEDKVKERELRCQTLEEEVKRVKAGKEERERLLQAEIEQLKVAFESEKAELNAKISTLNDEAENHRKEKPAAICLLCFSLASFHSWYHRVSQAFVWHSRPSAKAS